MRSVLEVASRSDCLPTTDIRGLPLGNISLAFSFVLPEVSAVSVTPTPDCKLTRNLAQASEPQALACCESRCSCLAVRVLRAFERVLSLSAALVGNPAGGKRL